MRFRRKLEEIEATNFTRQTFDFVKDFTNGKAHSFAIERSMNGSCTCKIPATRGDATASEGDWILKHGDGEFSVCKPDDFVKAYEPLQDVNNINERREVFGSWKKTKNLGQLSDVPECYMDYGDI